MSSPKKVPRPSARRQSTILATYGYGKDRGAVVYQVEHRQGVDVADAIRAAIRQHLATGEGRAMACSNGGDFNWGDAAVELTPQILARHGIRSFTSLPVDAWVDHDENFHHPLDEADVEDA